MDIDRAIQEGAERLRSRQVDEHRRTASLLLGHLLGLDRARLFIRSKEQLNESTLSEYASLIERRASGEPLQYITGRQEFYGLDFVVTPDVLIPRPETEILVERAIALAAEPRVSASLIVDVGTGSGCIAIALAAHMVDARIIAIDISSRALDVARENAERHNLSHRVEFIEGDLLHPLSNRGLEGAVDLVVSNPPYVAEQTAETLQREVRDWEPPSALFGGSAGLDFHGRLFYESAKFIRPGGHLVCEIGAGQLDEVEKLLDAATWELVAVDADLQSIPRALTVRRKL